MKPATLVSKLRAADAEYLASKVKRCTLCSLPTEVMDELRRLRSQGRSFEAISRALRAIDVKLTSGAIQRHWSQHERG